MLMVEVELSYGLVPQIIAKRERVVRGLRDPKYTGKAATNWGGNRIYQWRAWVMVNHLPVHIEAWGFSPFWAPGSGWSDDVRHQPWDKERVPQFEFVPCWAKIIGSQYKATMAQFIQDCIDGKVE
jgi:hypothetical protein